MTRRRVISRNFTTGEATPLVDARQEVDWYANATRRQANMVSIPHGPAFRRPAARYVARAKFADKMFRNLPFRFSTEQAYNIEAGDLYMRFYRTRAQLTVAQTDAAITNGTFGTSTSDWDDRSGAGSSIAHDASNARLNLVSNGTTEAHAEQDVTTTDLNQEHVLAVEIFGAPGDTVRVRVGTNSEGEELLADRALGIGTHLVAFTPTASPFYVGFVHKIGKTLQVDNVSILGTGAAVPVELPAPYLEADLRMIKFTQSADILYLRHQQYAGLELRRFGDRSWSLQRSVYDDGPYLPENSATTTLTPAATSGLGITVTASDAIGINGGRGFLATDLNRALTIKHSDVWGWGVIVEVTSTTAVKVDIRRAFNATTAQTAWKIGLLSDTTGHTVAAMFHEQRFWDFAGVTRLGRYDATAIGGFGEKLEFSPGEQLDAEAISGVLDSNEPHPIKWAHSGQVLNIGTLGGEARIGSFRNEGALTPTSAPQKFETFYGSSDVAPVRAGRALLFLQEHARKLRELVFSFEADGQVAPDLTRRSEHITRGGILEMAYAKEPWSIIWSVRADGVLLGFTYLREEEVTAWHRHPIGGGTVESVSSIPGDGYDEVWLAVNRTVEGVALRTVEVLDPEFTDEVALEDAFFVDGGITYEGAATQSITGLDHLEGLTVDVLGDGMVQPSRVVENGAITLQFEASKVQVGISARALIEPVRIEAAALLGTAQGQKQKIIKVTARLLRSLGLKQGPRDDALDPVPFGPGPNMNQPTELFTGDKELDYESDTTEDPRIILVQDQPLPFTLLAIIMEIDTKEGG